MPEPSSNHRPLNLRLRSDLVVQPVSYSVGETWIVKDPLALEHHQFTPEEYFLLDRLRSPSSLAELRREFEARFSPHRISCEAIWAFISRLHQAGLVISTATGQGDELLRRDAEDKARERSLMWTKILAMRFRGIDPDRWLTAIHAHCRWAFSWPMALLATLIVLVAGSLVLGHWTEFCSRLPSLAAMADLRNLVWLLVAMAFAKVLHELGHALVCKHFGGEVHEMGLLLLAFTPCLYCDVSSAWQMPNRWQRIFISAAGMLVELVLASLAVIVWWYSQPGIINLLALNLVVVCSVSTLLVNGNPLLRYDGYYILADLTQTPSLWQRSRQVLSQTASRWILGLKQTPDAITPSGHAGWLAIYALASKLYLATVLVGIIWMLVVILHPLHMETLAYGVGLAALGGVVMGPIMGANRIIRNPLRRRELRWGRLTLILAATIGIFAAALTRPMPYNVSAPVVLMPENATRIYTTVEGTLAEALPAGTEVQAGETIVRLENTEVALSLVKLQGEARLAKLRVEQLEKLRNHDSEIAVEIPTARATLAAIEAELADRQREAERLSIKAERAGTIVAVPSHSQGQDEIDHLPTWSGSLLDSQNIGATATPGTLVCWIADAEALEATLLINPAEAPRIRPGQTVRLLLDQFPNKVLEGTVREIARRDNRTARSLGTADRALERLATGLLPEGRGETQYQVRVELNEVPPGLIAGTRGQAKVATTPMRFGWRIVRWLSQTFRLSS